MATSCCQKLNVIPVAGGMEEPLAVRWIRRGAHRIPSCLNITDIKCHALGELRLSYKEDKSVGSTH